MAELDYAFLADYAQIEGGKLSALGASYTHAESKNAGGLWVTSVAGRVRAAQGETPGLAIKVVAPGSVFEVDSATTLEAGPDARSYGGKVGLLFAVMLAFPVVPGLHEVFITLDGKDVRRLAFEMSVS